MPAVAHDDEVRVGRRLDERRRCARDDDLGVDLRLWQVHGRQLAAFGGTLVGDDLQECGTTGAAMPTVDGIPG
jgi:hypothetical protein